MSASSSQPLSESHIADQHVLRQRGSFRGYSEPCARSQCSVCYINTQSSSIITALQCSPEPRGMEKNHTACTLIRCNSSRTSGLKSAVLLRRLYSRRAKRRVIVRSVRSASVEAGDIGDFVDGVGVEGGNTVSVILLVYSFRV